MSLNEEQKLEVENNFIEQQLEMLEKMGTDKILAEQELEKVTMSIFDFKTQILGIVAIIPIFMIFCAIIALVMKKDEPDMVV